MSCAVCFRSTLGVRACRLCGVAVCAECYPCEGAPARFVCKPCYVGLPPGGASCRLCRRAGGAQLPVHDAAMGFAHVRCAAMVPGCEVDVALGMVRGVTLVPKPVMELTCSVCGEAGGCVQCSWKKCMAAFHPECLAGPSGALGAPITALCAGKAGLVWLHCCPLHRFMVEHSAAAGSLELAGQGEPEGGAAAAGPAAGAVEGGEEEEEGEREEEEEGEEEEGGGGGGGGGGAAPCWPPWRHPCLLAPSPSPAAARQATPGSQHLAGPALPLCPRPSAL
jgi:hypothetical protein